MTKEEIKSTYSMRDILEKYGFPQPDRKGFINCLFHNEKTASMKIYEDSFHCFGCGANGDIFTFVQKIDNLSFREAFISLGGTYEKPTFESKLAIYRAKKRRETELIRRQKIKDERALNTLLVSLYRKWLDRLEPLSDAWTACYNSLQYQLYKMENLSERG